MNRLLLFTMISYFTSFKAFAQDRPNRIGDFILNETTITNLPKTCDGCHTKMFISINTGDEFLIDEVANEDLDNNYAGSSAYHELFYDTLGMIGWYSKDYACINDSVRVLFIPNYETDGLFIKNVLLKFYNDTLFYIRASLSKAYQNILLEKYRGKGHKTAEKKTKRSCKSAMLQKYTNIYSEYFFSQNDDSSNYAKIIFDFKITKDCDTYTDNRIEIFNLKTQVKELHGRLDDLQRAADLLKKRRIAEADKEKIEKEKKLKRF